MIFLYILLGIVLLLSFILWQKATVIIEYRDEINLAVRALGFVKIKILPKKPKENRVRLGRYTKKKITKRALKQKEKELAKKQKKQEKKERKKQKKQANKALSSYERDKKPNLSENLDMILEILTMFKTRFFKHFRIKVARLRIGIATGDAASTAILYGAVCQAVYPIACFLTSFTNINDLEKADIDVYPDYLGDNTSADVKISFSLRVWHLADILIRALQSYTKTRKSAMRRAAVTRERARRIMERRKGNATKQG